MGRKLINLIKKDTVLVAAWLLAVLSAFFVHPGPEYAGYIDLRTLGILWALMLIIQGWNREGVFDSIGKWMLGCIRSVRMLIFALVFICFISSMLITNDVALITFVPFAIMLLENMGRRDLTISVIVLQTVAANLGSMLTPIGNPQNLYLYGLSGMSAFELVNLMLPYTLMSAVLLIVCVFIMTGVKKADSAGSLTGQPADRAADGSQSRRRSIIYLFLFIFMLLGVLRLLPWIIPVLAAAAVILAVDRSLLLKADYALLATFTGFFIFTGNMGRIPSISDFLQGMISGREVPVAVLLSQVISNVPAALLLSGFTTDHSSLLIGVDLGGLGTLIASMASLISWKAYAGVENASKGRYLTVFTLVNLVFLSVLAVTYMFIAVDVSCFYDIIKMLSFLAA